MSSVFITDLENDPYRQRLIMFVYGPQKIGKTSMVLRMLKGSDDQIVYLLSADKGTKQVHLGPSEFQGRLAITYPQTLADWRRAVGELMTRVPKVAEKKGAQNLWVVVDTISHMQTNLLAEARRIQVNQSSTKIKRGNNEGDIYFRDATTSVDYNINVGHMAELTNQLISLPANILLIGLQKEGRDTNDRTIYVPALSGQSREKIIGDADIVARMDFASGDERRVLYVAPGRGWQSGDRTGRLSEIEEPDLLALRGKVFNQQ